jgi:hypothetical protein
MIGPSGIKTMQKFKLVILCVCLIFQFFSCTQERPSKNNILSKKDKAFLEKVNFSPNFFFKNKYQSKYFTFYHQDNVGYLDYFSQFSDGFVDLVNEKYFKNTLSMPLDFYILKDRNEFQNFLKTKMFVESPPNWGIFLPMNNALVTYEASGLGTFAHIITYPLLRENYQQLPFWAAQSIATLFEKIYCYYDEDKLIFKYGFQNPWRIKELDKSVKINNINLKSIVYSSPHRDTNQHEKRLLAVFMYEQNKWEKYFDLVRNNSKDGYDTFFEAAFEMPLNKITPLWKEYLNLVEKNKDIIFQIPPSQMFKSKSMYEKTIGRFVSNS